jgi:hypothetical protein
MSRPILLLCGLLLSSTALAQDKPKGVEQFNEFNAKPLEDWEWDDDERLRDLIDQLQQKEVTLQAIDASIAKAEGKKRGQKMDENMAWRSTQRMDLNGGGPIRWDAFYGRNAENFFYHPKDPNTTYHTTTALRQVDPTSTGGVPGNQGVPAHQRPPQFDYIYRGYEKAQERARGEARDLADKVDDLKTCRRQLEGEVVILWMKVAFRVIDRDKLPENAALRFAFRPAQEAAEGAEEQAAALTLASRFLATAMLFNEDLAESDARQAFGGLSRIIEKNRQGFEDGVLKMASLRKVSGDKTKPLGQFKFLSRKLEDTSKTLSEGYRGWQDGDASDDEPTKFNGLKRIQNGVVQYSKILLALNELVGQMEKEWPVDLNTDSTEFTPRWDVAYVPPTGSSDRGVRPVMTNDRNLPAVRVTYRLAEDGKTTTTVSRLSPTAAEDRRLRREQVAPGIVRSTHDFRDAASLKDLRGPLLRLTGITHDELHQGLYFDASQNGGMNYPERFRLPVTVELDLVARDSRSAIQIGLPDSTPPSQPFVTISTGDGFKTVDIVDRWTISNLPNADQPETKQVASVIEASSDKEAGCVGRAPLRLDPKEIYRLGIGVFPGNAGANSGFYLRRISVECCPVPTIGIRLKEGDSLIIDGITEGSLAQRAGLGRGERVCAVNGVRPKDSGEAIKLLGMTDYGEVVKLELDRDGIRRKVEIKVE